MGCLPRTSHVTLFTVLIKLEPNTNNKIKGNSAAAIWTALRRFHFHLSSIPPSAAFNYTRRNTDLKQTSGGNTAFWLTQTQSFINAKGTWVQIHEVFNSGKGTQVLNSVKIHDIVLQPESKSLFPFWVNAVVGIFIFNHYMFRNEILIEF